MIWVVVVVCVIVTLIVVLLSLLTLDKGYGYKHTIDPLPQQDEGIGKKDESDSANGSMNK